MDDFYKEYILDHYRNPRNFGHLDNPTAKAEDLNPLCGDKIAMDITVSCIRGRREERPLPLCPSIPCSYVILFCVLCGRSLSPGGLLQEALSGSQSGLQYCEPPRLNSPTPPPPSSALCFAATSASVCRYP